MEQYTKDLESSVEEDIEESPEESLDEKVSKYLASKNSSGDLDLPDDVSEELIYAINAEKRRRDTQSAYTKATQQAAVLKAEKDELLNRLSNSVQVDLTDRQLDELERMKMSDPDLWRKKLNQYENSAKNSLRSNIDKELSEVSVKSADEASLIAREREVEIFLQNNPQLGLDKYSLANVVADEIPPRITRKLEEGRISFSEFLDEVRDYLPRKKTTRRRTESLDQPNLSNYGGSHNPSDSSKKKKAAIRYETAIF